MMLSNDTTGSGEPVAADMTDQEARQAIEGRARIAGLRAARMNAERRRASTETPRREAHIRPSQAVRGDGLADLCRAAAARRAGPAEEPPQRRDGRMGTPHRREVATLRQSLSVVTLPGRSYRYIAD
jgi:hypothetical protein